MVTCILLAAGSSRRFGSPKPLARIGKQTVIELLQHKLIKSKVLETIVVLGPDAELIAPLTLKDRRIRCIINEKHREGQTSSFKSGAGLLSAESQGVMLLPADIPLVKQETINLLIETFLKKSPLILIPTYKEKKGHPPIFSKKILGEFKNLKNDEPLSRIQHRHPAEILYLPVDDPGVILSFNTKEELHSLMRPFQPD